MPVAVSVAVSVAVAAGGAPSLDLRDCRARVTVTCEQVTTDPDAVCPACADQLEALLPSAPHSALDSALDKALVDGAGEVVPF